MVCPTNGGKKGEDVHEDAPSQPNIEAEMAEHESSVFYAGRVIVFPFYIPDPNPCIWAITRTDSHRKIYPALSL